MRTPHLVNVHFIYYILYIKYSFHIYIVIHRQTFSLDCDTILVVRQADDPFVCFGAKPDKGFWTRDLNATWSRQGNASWELEEGTQRRSWRQETQSGSWQSTPDREETSRHEVQQQWGKTIKMSQHSSWFVEFSLEIHTSISLHMHRECSVTKLPFLHLEMTQAILFVCSLFFFSHSLDCISVAMKKCVIPLSEPLDDHRPRLKWFRRSWCIRGAEGVSLQYRNSLVWLDTLDAWSWDRNQPNFTLDLVSDRSAKRTTSAREL